MQLSTLRGTFRLAASSRQAVAAAPAAGSTASRHTFNATTPPPPPSSSRPLLTIQLNKTNQEAPQSRGSSDVAGRSQGKKRLLIGAVPACSGFRAGAGAGTTTQCVGHPTHLFSPPTNSSPPCFQARRLNTHGIHCSSEGGQGSAAAAPGKKHSADMWKDEPGTVETTVASIKQVTPTTKLFTLRVEDPSFSFKAGQWLDVFMPGNPAIGGFSIANAPCTAGSGFGTVLRIRAGGEVCVHDVEPEDSYLFVGGGIGISPLHGMLQRVLAQPGNGAEGPGGRGTPFSAPPGTPPFLWRVQQLDRRMESADLALAIEELGGIPGKPSVHGSGGKLQVHMCGPPSMIDATEAELSALGVPADQVHFERWW
eukprot:gene13719-210_t